MKILNQEQVLNSLPFKTLIAQMHDVFAAGVTCPDRHNHSISQDDQNASLLLMSGWHDNIGCVKIVNVHPDNGKHNLPSISASVLVFDRITGEHLAILDGDAVTVKRTAAASALAADYLAPQNAEHLLVVGSGKIAEQLPDAFSAVRPITQVSIWNRKRAGAERLAEKLSDKSYAVNVVDDLGKAVHDADIISAATLAIEPIIQGKYLRGNQHIDLIDSFKPSMREADDALMQRAKGAIFVDAPFTITESGEIAIPMDNGVLNSCDIAGDLTALCNGKKPVEKSDVTVFKGAGNAVMDLAAAITVMKNMR